MARIVGHLPVEAPERRRRAAEDATEARHIQAIRLPAQGRAVLEVAGVLAFAPRWAEQLAARCNAPSGRFAACPPGGSQAMARMRWAAGGGATGARPAC